MKNILKVSAVALLAVAVIFSIGLTKSSKSAWLGVYTQSVDEDIADEYELKVDFGALISKVIPDSPADEAGMGEGDVIVSYNGKKVTDSDDLIDLIEDSNAGDDVTIEVINDKNDKISYNLKLDSRPKKYRNYYHDYGDLNHLKGLKIPAIPGVPMIPHIPSASGYRKIIISDDNNYIGVYIDDLSDQLGDYFGVEKGRGVLVSGVEEESPAEKAGLKAGDVIIAADDEKVYETDELREIINDKEAGEKVSLKFLRNKKEMALDVEVAERDKDSEHTLYFDDSDFDFDIDMSGIKRIKKIDLSEDDDNWDIYFDSKEYAKEMKELSKELKKLQNEFKGMEEENNSTWKLELNKLQEELKEIKRKMD